ncbi:MULTISPECIES: PKD domain-containing protein [Sphingobacterium]|uniref:PKD domain-containing protein n=2 Tax=Sphingobacterium TaxID=28453 RepID=UPI0013DAB8A9|nr:MULTISPECIES: PKD domain-containing protein [unclassified Sphingobacterium]
MKIHWIITLLFICKKINFQWPYGTSKSHYARCIVIGEHAASRSFVFMRLLLYGYFILNIYSASAQKDSTIIPIDTFESKIDFQQLPNGVSFKPILRPLIQVPGGRTPYYKYLWDFGDGHFSTQAEPIHQYAKPGEYEVSLYAVNNYSNGPKPKRPIRKIKNTAPPSALAHRSSNTFEQNFFASNGVFQIFKLSDAKPGEDISLILGVQTEGKKGKVYLLSNEKIAGLNGFQFAHQSTYYKENIDSLVKAEALSSMWASVKQSTFTKTGSPDYGIKEVSTFQDQQQAINYFKHLYNAYNSLTAYDIDPSNGDQQFSLINLDVTEDMLVDTNAIVTITGVFIPEDGLANVHQVDIPVVKSHDPNKMSIKPARMNYRFQKKRKTLTYKVQFQNDGEGDAKNVRLEMRIPDEIIKNSFKLKALYPKCDSCETSSSRGCYRYYLKDDGTLVFHFKDISLPGTAAKDITDMDSTKGFILFEVETQKKLKNKSFEAYTNIYFDNNPPIKTNTATTRFLRTLSPFITIGATSTFGTPKENELSHKFKTGYQIGFGIAPTAPYRKPYWQIELYTSYFKRESQSPRGDKKGEHPYLVDGKTNYFVYNAVSDFEKREYLTLQIPVQIRYNFNPFFSMGAGASARKDFNIKASGQTTYYLERMGANGVMEIAQMSESKDLSKTNSAIKINPFLDLNVGSVNLGPALGLRFTYDKQQKWNGGIYGIFRF